MKSKRYYIIISLVSMVFLSSCENSWMNCIKGNNRITREARNIGDFTNLSCYGDFVVLVYKTQSSSLHIDADDNLLQYIETFIQGSTLIIQTQDNRCIRSSKPIIITVTSPNIIELKLAGSGIIYCDSLNSSELKYTLDGSGIIDSRGLTTDFFEVNLSGSGDIKLDGFATQTDFSISGSGNIRAINLEQDKCYANISGSGNIFTFVNDRLDVLITGSGSVFYKGSPLIDSKVTGSGRVLVY